MPFYSPADYADPADFEASWAFANGLHFNFEP
jgi:hypothetical protein